MDYCGLLRRNLYCSIELEYMIAELLSSFADYIKNRRRLVYIVLKFIAFESRTHGEILELLARETGLYEVSSNCSEVVGYPWTVVEELLNDVRNGRIRDLEEFLQKQEWIEGAVGEETYQKVFLPLLLDTDVARGCMGSEYKDSFSAVLNKIILDEKAHENLLKLLRSSKPG